MPIRKFIANDGFEAYYLNDIGNILKLKKCRDSVRLFTADEIVSSNQKTEYNIITMHKYKNTERKCPHVNLVTIKGVKRLIINSRSVHANDLAKFLGIDVYEQRFAPIESTTLKNIIEVFEGEQMQLQYTVGNYRVDLYFIDHKIAVECDEEDHNKRDPEYEINRQRFIEQTLNCKFVRYNPHAVGFNINAVSNGIFKLIVGRK
jgi:very-short-patch-repair endonuclease